MRLSILLRAVVLPIFAVAGVVLILRSYQFPFPVIAICLIAFALFVDLATLTRGHLQNALVTLATVAFGLGVVEGVLEWRLPHVAKNSTALLWARDPELGYHPAHAGIVPAEKSVDGHFSYKVAYTIDDGLRRITRSPADGPGVRFFGDSYTFGEGLNDADTLPQAFANLTGANVLNYGYPGWSPAQALRILQLGSRDKELAGARLFVLQTAGFHIERTSCLPEYAAGFPRYVTVDGKLKLDGKCKPALGQSTGIYRSLVQATAEQVGHADAQNFLNIVNAFTQLAKSKYHADVLVLYMRDDSEVAGVGFTSQQIMDAFREGGAMVVDASTPAAKKDAMELPYDGHPTALANKVYAGLVADEVKKDRPGLLETATKPDGMKSARQ